MPTEAFYKLDPAKKELILASAIHEFSELPYEKVSIFKIAQNADVSRSGFYYYFKDKRDIYEYLINDIKNEFIELYGLRNGDFDIFGLGESIFEFITGIKGTKRDAFFRRVVANTNADDLKLFFSFIDKPACDCELKCSLEGLDIRSADQLKGIIMFMVTGIMFSAGGYMDDEYDLDEARKKLNCMFDIIRFGTVKGV